nr:MAG: maturation protein [Leviviridae sp.]
MSVGVRRRSRSYSAGRGTRRLLSNGQLVGESSPTNREYMEDTTGFRDRANYLYQEKRLHNTIGTISGSDNLVYTYEGYPYLNQYDFSHLPPSSTAPSLDEVITEVVANTNPSKPKVSVPTFAIEAIRELPDMLYHAGSTLLHSRAKNRSRRRSSELDENSAVAFNFGWDQVLRDVGSMFHFTEQVNKRVEQLTAARGAEGKTTGYTVWDDSSIATFSNVTVWSTVGFLKVDITKRTTRRRWASVHWSGDQPGFRTDAASILADARRIVHGWRVSPADVWNLLPWSWFVDYFVNVGDYLEANGNSLGISPTQMCVMTETRTIVSHKVVERAGWMKAVPAEYELLTRERTPRVPTLSFRNVPLLGPKQLVTLSSIIRNRGKYGSPG